MEIWLTVKGVPQHNANVKILGENCLFIYLFFSICPLKEMSVNTLAKQKTRTDASMMTLDKRATVCKTFEKVRRKIEYYRFQ